MHTGIDECQSSVILWVADGYQEPWKLGESIRKEEQALHETLLSEKNLFAAQEQRLRIGRALVPAKGRHLISARFQDFWVPTIILLDPPRARAGACQA